MRDRERHSSKALALIDEAFVALRDRDQARAHKLLDRAAAMPEAAFSLVEGRIAQCRGTAHYHQGQDDLALRELTHAYRTLRDAAPEKAARVLDVLGMVYASRNNLHAAREMHLMAIEMSKASDDMDGVATSYGQIGRLALAWGDLDDAEKYFRADLDLAARLDDRRSVAQINNHLGQICMARGTWSDAAKYIDLAIEQSTAGGWSVIEALARKDRAVMHCECEELDAAQSQVDRARALLEKAGFAEGEAYLALAEGRIATKRREWDRGEQRFAAAIDAFSRLDEPAEVARARMHLARLRMAREAPDVVSTLLEALALAERTRRDGLVCEIEAELKRVDAEAMLRRELRRSRGFAPTGDPVSLHNGVHEPASVIFLDVVGSTDFARVTDPEELMSTLNQLMAEVGERLDAHGASVTAYLGDGLMAIVRGKNHAVRAVDAALDIGVAVREFNAPRELLGLRPMGVRTGVRTGEVFIGFVGTYNKMDFTAVGTAVNLAARLQSEADPGVPAISSITHEAVSEQFEFAPTSPRTVSLKGLGERAVWDVIGRRPGRSIRRTTKPY